MTDNRPSIDRVKQVLRYCADTGELRWLVDMGRNKTAGKIAGCRRPDGYIAARIDGRLCLAHHLVWVLVKGEWPSELIDHEDLDTSNNRFENLREASHSQNKANKRANANNTSGFKGVCFVRSRAHLSTPWMASIKVDHRNRYLGTYATPEAAHAAYVAAAIQHFGDFARAA